MSPFPYLVIFPQDEHERLLIDRLADGGVHVERPTELLGFEQVGQRVRVHLRRADGTEEACEAEYLAGCDGAHSQVRETLGISFAGSTYEHLFYVADVEAAGPVINGELHLVLDDADFLAVFPLTRPGHARVIGTARVGGADVHDKLTWDDVSKDVFERMHIEVARVNWFSTYRVHHRVAERFRGGRAFLLGDAAHIHSPVGGQGMNTGIGDAVNLAWKLANVLHGQAPAALLDTYEPERIAFARRLVATTDRAFTTVTSNGPIARVVRMDVAPRVLPALFHTRLMRRFMFRTLSQTAIQYRSSALSEGMVGRVRGGDRLPWVPLNNPDHVGSDNFTALESLDWQVHVYGRCSQDASETCARRRLPLHVFAWTDRAHDAGLKQHALYLIRPDGYIALADADARAATLERYLDSRRITASS